MPINFITASCVISNQKVFKNGQLLYESNAADTGTFLTEVYKHFQINYPKFYKMDNLSKLGLLCNDLLISGSDLKYTYQPNEIGLVLSNANASLDADIRYIESTKTIASPALFVYTLPNIVIGEISIRHQFKGENAFFIFEQFDADFIQQYVNNLLNNNILQACICGWVEIVGNEYKAVLYLAEKNKSNNSIPFDTENSKKIYQL